ncbi:ABC transporter permease [Cohnella zeiphila]|uniref:Sugar ABC transporter permease n=1 Tax=Cohnella zeiphila TaxID=2761120 RepID=A0A7X0SNH7_9BACL|nr:ABC transporter permease subunit [Cohnella zeiphila]MBB6733250.1 sugar ABC transporter permease [Cohnella zeiphila]
MRYAKRTETAVARSSGSALWRRMSTRYDLYLMLLLPTAYYLIFQYAPMYGMQIAFKNFIAAKGIGGSPWVGLDQFTQFFDSYYFWRLIRNTLSISVFSLIFAFPVPILLALLINEIGSSRFKRWVQNVTYIPHFISLVVVVGMLGIFLDGDHGFVNQLLKEAGLPAVSFLQSPGWFKPILILSNIWQTMGFSSIIYIAALSGIDPAQYEAAMIDGASRLQRVRHVSLPGILPTMTILFILEIGHLMNVGFEKILLMQNQLNMESSDVIATFVYRVGIQQAQYSYTAAVGLFNAVINFILLIAVNWAARRRGGASLW